MLEVGEKGKNMKGLAVQIVVILVCMNIVHSWVICAKAISESDHTARAGQSGHQAWPAWNHIKHVLLDQTNLLL